MVDVQKEDDGFQQSHQLSICPNVVEPHIVVAGNEVDPNCESAGYSRHNCSVLSLHQILTKSNDSIKNVTNISYRNWEEAF